MLERDPARQSADRPAPGPLDAWAHRDVAGAARLHPRHPPPKSRRAAAGDARRARWRDRLRRTDERQRRTRVGPARDRLARRAAQRKQAAARRLPRRADAGPSIGRPGVHLSRQAQRDRLLPGHADGGRGPSVRCAVSALTSIIGIATASNCRAARGCWRPATANSPIRPSLSARARWRCSSTRRSPTR